MRARGDEVHARRREQDARAKLSVGDAREQSARELSSLLFVLRLRKRERERDEESRGGDLILMDWSFSERLRERKLSFQGVNLFWRIYTLYRCCAF